jgi:hypothetical protein
MPPSGSSSEYEDEAAESGDDVAARLQEAAITGTDPSCN